jgi:subtilisin family serine protease
MIKRLILLTGVVAASIAFMPASRAYGMYEFQDTTKTPKNWYLLDPETDKVQGLSVEKTYNTLLKGKPSRTVLVAVIDSGIDIDHEDLKDILWTNEDEIAGNNIDDDKNGYVDDIHGWNFIGGKSGNVNQDTYEVTREYARLKPKYENFQMKDVNKKNKSEYNYWLRVKKKYEHDFDSNKKQYDQYSALYEKYVTIVGTIKYCDSVLTKTLGQPATKSSLASIPSSNDTVMFAKQTLTEILSKVNVEGDIVINEFATLIEKDLNHLQDGVEHFKTAVEYGYNTEFDSRAIVGDNGMAKGYGNNDVEGPDPKHGTHVAGIIAANRKNAIGVNGIADNVRIMSIRAVPNGDERDKDIANAITYAVDNGARIINMSFGKSFSPEKNLVDKAVKYAESKGVLMIHAAGNDGKNIDTTFNYPTRKFAKGEAKSWLEIGASSAGEQADFIGSFSNYGKKSVDLFAPGVEIYSTTPDNTYEDLQGTSMACPATAGVAAILMSYFPDLSAVDVKNILRQSTRKFDGLKVTQPGDDENKVAFSDLSSTGGIVNAYEAVKMATTYTPKPTKK